MFQIKIQNEILEGFKGSAKESMTKPHYLVVL
jgi:hypothetical protein